MAEGVGPCPQVFVIDSKASYISAPTRKKPSWGKMSQKLLFLLMGLTMLGLVIEGFFIYNIYKKMEALSMSNIQHLCENLSDPNNGHQAGDKLSMVGEKEWNEIPAHLEEVKQRPFAQLIGSGSPEGENNVVQWLHTGGETITNNMGYENGRLLVQMDGHYYLYSKVTLDVAEECVVIQHLVMKVTKAYDESIELMKSKSFRCLKTTSSGKFSEAQHLWNSFLAGIFHLENGDEVFVKLDGIKNMRPGTTDNFMGAFMISPYTHVERRE